MRITYDPKSGSANIFLTDSTSEPDPGPYLCDTPDGLDVMVLLDWRDGRIMCPSVVGGASHRLPPELLAQAKK